MSSQKTFHWRRIENSAPLQLLLGIMKSADHPLSGMEIQLEAQRMGTWIANPSTCLNEIGQNEGYEVSPGTRFPDGKHRYWLMAAPGWTPAWGVNAELRVVPHVGNCELRIANDELKTRQEHSEQRAIRTCRACGMEIGTDGSPFCNEECKSAFFNMGRSVLPAMSTEE